MTVNELREMNVKIRGYTMPDDNAPDFYKRCKVGEAFEIMSDYLVDFPEEFYNLIFTVTDENDDCLFEIRRDLKTIYLGEFDLTEDVVREALGIE